MKNKFILCKSVLNRDAVRRETIDGAEHIIVSSFTLPDDIVMNGGLYPASEIRASFKTLERTLAPVEHPQDADGNFISASDPLALNNFYVGAYNVNVTQEGNRIHIEKHINVNVAKTSEKGKRLLDRISELETNENARPLHTSVGVFLEVEELQAPMTNADGDQYTWIARKMVFDHDAILLDSVAAATPEKGVGVAVNSKGVEHDVQYFSMDKPETVKPIPNDYRTNVGGVSFNSIIASLSENIEKVMSADYVWIMDVFQEEVIFEMRDTLFSVPYRVDNGAATIVGIPLPVERVVTYIPKVNQKGEDEMKELILNKLKEAGVKGIDEMTEAQLLDAYNQLQANEAEAQATAEAAAAAGTDETQTPGGIAEAVANALKPVTDQLSALEAKLNESGDAEKAKLVDVVVNSGKFPGLDAEAAAMLSTDKLKAMAANCGTAHALPFSANNEGADDAFKAPSAMPE